MKIDIFKLQNLLKKHKRYSKILKEVTNYRDPKNRITKDENNILCTKKLKHDSTPYL